MIDTLAEVCQGRPWIGDLALVSPVIFVTVYVAAYLWIAARRAARGLL